MFWPKMELIRNFYRNKMSFFSSSILFLFSFFLLVLMLLIVKKRKKGHLNRSLDMSLFLIKLPKYEVQEKNQGQNQREEERRMIFKMEQIYSNFLYLDSGESFLKRFFNGSPRVVFEIASEIGQGDISFYIAVR